MREYYKGNLNDIDLTKEQEVLLQEPDCGFNVFLNFEKLAPSAQTIKLKMSNTLDSADIKFGKNVQNFSLEHPNGLIFGSMSGNWNFAEKIPNLKEIRLNYCNMKYVTYLDFGPNVQRVFMINCDQFWSIPNLDRGWNFDKIAPNAEVFDMSRTVFPMGGVRLCFGSNAKKIAFNSCYNVSMKAPGAQIVDLRNSSISDVDINSEAEVLIYDRRRDKDITLKIKDGMLRLHEAIYIGGYRYFRDITK